MSAGYINGLIFRGTIDIKREQETIKALLRESFVPNYFQLNEKKISSKRETAI